VIPHTFLAPPSSRTFLATSCNVNPAVHTSGTGPSRTWRGLSRRRRAARRAGTGRASRPPRIRSSWRWWWGAAG